MDDFGFGSSKFDWNDNGRRDQFDDYMDCKVSGSDNAGYSSSSGNRHNDLTGISFAGKPLNDAEKDGDGITILKSIAVTAFCIGGIALPVISDMGELGTLLCIFGGIAAGIAILKIT